MQINAQEELQATMNSYIQSQPTTTEAPNRENIFAHYQCEAFNTGLRECAMRQAKWPYEMSKLEHCNRLLHVVKEAYFTADKTTEMITTTPTPISTTSSTTSAMTHVITTTVEAASVVPKAATLTALPAKATVPLLSKTNILFIFIGMILGAPIYIGMHRYCNPNIQRFQLPACYWARPSYRISTAFAYVSAKPAALHLRPEVEITSDTMTKRGDTTHLAVV